MLNLNAHSTEKSINKDGSPVNININDKNSPRKSIPSLNNFKDVGDRNVNSNTSPSPNLNSFNQNKTPNVDNVISLNSHDRSNPNDPLTTKNQDMHIISFRSQTSSLGQEMTPAQAMQREFNSKPLNNSTLNDMNSKYMASYKAHENRFAKDNYLEDL